MLSSKQDTSGTIAIDHGHGIGRRAVSDGGDTASEDRVARLLRSCGVTTPSRVTASTATGIWNSEPDRRQRRRATNL